MKISIIIPVYNVEPYIEDCLKSVAEQTYKGDIECIIVDDCTPDGSCAIIEHFINEYNGSIDFKLLHHTVNRGLSAARNTGIDAAAGEYIYFLDSDDEITPECIELLTKPLKNNKYDFVIGNYETVGSDAQFPPLLLEEGSTANNSLIRTLYFANKWYMMAWNKLCNLDYIRMEKLYFKEGLINEDELWSFQLACTAQSMYVIDKCTYTYKIRTNSITSTTNLVKKAEAFAIITKEAYEWSTQKGFASNYDVFNKIMWFREYSLRTIAEIENSKDRKKTYIRCYKRLRIAPWKAYKNKTLSKRSLFKELYNFMPGLLGYWYIRLYNSILRR